MTIATNAPLPSATRARASVEVPRNHYVRWPAIFAGVAVAAASWILLHALAMGIGLTSIEPNSTHALDGVGATAGIGSLIAPIVAMFIGGLVVGRFSPIAGHVDRALHGAVVWGIGSVVMVALLFGAMTTLIGGAANAGGKLAGAAAGAVGTAVGSMDRDAVDALGLDGDDLVAPVNQRLRAEGKPEVTPAQIKAATRQIATTAMRTGTLDRAAVTQAIAQRTALTPRDAEEIAAGVEMRVREAREQAEQLAQRAKVAALQAAESTGKALIGLAGALAVGLFAAVGGALLTRPRDHVDVDAAVYATPVL